MRKMQQTLLQKVKEYSEKYRMLQEGDYVLVGLSGGADSVCLLHILREMAQMQHFSVCALHVHHGIRGEEADADEQFAKELCEALCVPFFSVKTNVPDYAEKNGVSLEEGGRILRYAALERIMAEQGCTKIALAHHANDLAETMLFHLFRGSRLSGLAGIPPVRGPIIRPLLCCSRQEIEGWLLEKQAAYCTDQTNFLEDYTRNKIRHRLLTYAQEQINPKAVQHMQQTAEYMRQVKDYVEGETKNLFSRAVQAVEDGFLVSGEALLTAPVFLQQQLIYDLLVRLGGAKDRTEVHVTQVLALLEKQSGRGVDLPGGIRAVRSYDTLRIMKRKPALEEEARIIQIPGEYPWGQSGAVLQFSLFSYENTAKIPKNRYTKWFDYDKIKDAIILRKRQQGDVIRLKSGTKTIKALFINEKIPQEERNQIMLVACGKEILWVPGVRGSEAYLVEATTENVLQIELKPANQPSE